MRTHNLRDTKLMLNHLSHSNSSQVIVKATQTLQLLNSSSNFQYPIIAEGATKPPAKAIERLIEVLNWVKDFVTPTGFVAGTDYLTLADIRYGMDIFKFYYYFL